MLNVWSVTTNFRLHKGGRILVAWLPSVFYVQILETQEQYIHLAVQHVLTYRCWKCTFVYGFNHPNERKPLWDSLCNIGDAMHDPWAVLGDFNNVLCTEDRIGALVNVNDFVDFKECLGYNNLVDIPFKGCYYTWNNKHKGEDRVYCKLDRALGNDSWFSVFKDAVVEFLPERDFDHRVF